MADSSRFVIAKSSDFQYYFYLRAANGEVLFTSETYTRKQSAVDGIDAVKRAVPTAVTVDISDK